MANESWKISFANLTRALQRFEEALAEPTDAKRMMVDASIQRFEFTFEIFWKTLKHLLAAKGKQAVLPRDVLSEAYMAGWLDQEKLWLDMLEDRNQTSHTYKESKAQEIYLRLPAYLNAMQEAHRKLQSLFFRP